MSSVVYAIVFKGETLEGFETFSVKAHMAKLLKADAERISKLFSGGQVVLKKTPDKATAIKYGTVLKKIGADVKIRIIKSANPSVNPPAAKPEPATALAVVPNKGNIFDAKPAVKAPEIDISDLNAVANWDGPLEPPREENPPDLNLSGFQLAEPDEGNLTEPEPLPEKIEAPDFGLDEPGAILDALKPDVVELNPDTSAMSLAYAGSDLLADEDKKPEAEPVVPDVSSISLVPEFD